MARLWMWRHQLTGWQGAPGVNTFFTTVGEGLFDQAALDDTNNQFDAAYGEVMDYLAGGVQVWGSIEVLEIDVATGVIQEIHSPTTMWGHTAPGTDDAMSRATMAKLQFHTDAIVDGRRVRGGPFLGPLGTNGLMTDGGVSTLLRNAAQDMFEGLTDVTGPFSIRLAVYQRPRTGHPTLPDRPGSFGHVQSVSMWERPAVMRSRRD